MFFLEYIESVLSSFYFIFFVALVSFVLKTYILCVLTKKTILSEKVERPLYFLILILIGNMFSDLAWIVKLSRVLFVPDLSYKIVLFIIRIAWIFFLIQYQAIALFLESLVKRNYVIPVRQKILFLISSALGAFFGITAIIDFDCIDPALRRFPFEPMIQNVVAFYTVFPVILPSLFVAIQKLRSSDLPALLKRQLKILIQGLIVPLLLADFIQLFPFKVYAITWIAHSYAGVGLSTMLITLAIYFCTRKIFGLRFLNLKNHVHRPMDINFIDDFKGVLERFSKVTNFRELGHITQGFFKDTFHIPLSRSHFYLRTMESIGKDKTACIVEDTVTSVVEAFLATRKDALEAIMKEEKILIYDEIDFTHFYDACENSEIVLQFLRSITADVFLPIYENGKLIAYIIVERHARTGHFYSNVERDEFIVFSSYLGNIINLLQNKRLDVLIEQEQQLRSELYLKHQELNQYKESIRSFVRKGKVQHIGILFYKNRHFTYANQAAKELIDINVNTHQGHPLSQALRQLAHQVEMFKLYQSMFVKNINDVTLVISAVPQLEHNTVIITVSYPDISDIVKQSLDLLKDPTESDYLLYLQTTESGRMINKLIPGNGAMLLNFKIMLLKAALSRKALLLDALDQDVRSVAEIVHHISLREQLHTLALQGTVNNFDVAIALFGINPIFGLAESKNKPLLETLDSVGTLFITNIHFLDMETQENLAQFIKYGYYTIFKSDQKMVSDVRIICSTNQNLSALVQAGKFSKTLFQELKVTTVTMPSLITLPDDELHALAEGFTQQAVSSDDLNHLLVLTDREKSLLTANRPASLQDLKVRVQQMLVKKSKKNMIYQEVEFNPTYNVTDPDLIAAARLGKQALKDPRIMMMLWNKFKNQNKISAFLGVNRSSVNRRCKEYNLI